MAQMRRHPDTKAAMSPPTRQRLLGCRSGREQGVLLRRHRCHPRSHWRNSVCSRGRLVALKEGHPVRVCGVCACMCACVCAHQAAAFGRGAVSLLLLRILERAWDAHRSAPGHWLCGWRRWPIHLQFHGSKPCSTPGCWTAGGRRHCVWRFPAIGAKSRRHCHRQSQQISTVTAHTSWARLAESPTNLAPLARFLLTTWGGTGEGVFLFEACAVCGRGGVCCAVCGRGGIHWLLFSTLRRRKFWGLICDASSRVSVCLARTVTLAHSLFLSRSSGRAETSHLHFGSCPYVSGCTREIERAEVMAQAIYARSLCLGPTRPTVSAFCV